jgi:glutamyl-tRNA reductase
LRNTFITGYSPIGNRVSSKELMASRSPDRNNGVSSLSITIIGTSFKSSSIELREQLAKALSERGNRSVLHNLPGVKESALLITCNRVEVFFATDDLRVTEAAFFDLVKILIGNHSKRSFYKLDNLAAIEHIFNVAAGLDSMVVGEEQILSQVKEVGVSERVSNHSKAVLSALFDTSYRVGKRVRDEYSRGVLSTSISSFALRFAIKKLKNTPKNVLLIGTGKTIKLAARELTQSEIYVATKRSTLPSGLSNVRIVPYYKIKDMAKNCDLIVSATNHNGFILTKEDLTDNRSRIMLDLAFPRNIDPLLRESEFTQLYDLDDLARESFVYDNLSERNRASSIITQEAREFRIWLVASKLTNTTASIYQWAEQIRKMETRKAIRRLPKLSARERRIVEAMGKRLLSKILSPTTQFVKSSTDSFTQEERLRLVEKVFLLEGRK